MSTDNLSIQGQISGVSALLRPRSESTLLATSLTGVDNSTALADSSEQQDAVASLSSVFDSLDEATTAVNRYRQLRNRSGPESSSSSSEVTSLETEDDEHSKVNTILTVLNTEGRDNARLVLQHMRALFPDESDLVMALREILKNNRLTRAQRRTLEDALEIATEEADQKKLNAGINIALKAQIFGEKLSLSPTFIRQAYRDFLESEETELDLYQSWVALFGASRRRLIIDFMESALTADMDSNLPSCTRTEFSALLNKLVQLKNIRSADFQFMRRFLSKTIVKSLKREEEHWLFFLFTIMKRPDLLQVSLLDAAGKEYQGMVPRQQSEVISWLRCCLAIFTHAFFSDEEQRSLIMDNLSELSSNLYQAELSREHVL